MQWESIGFKTDPFKTEPITENTLELYTGNRQKIKSCQFALKSKDVIIVIEGNRGVGTTSFANYLRFNAKKSKDYFTPTNEIGVEPNWNTETLLAAIISNIVMELELYHHRAIKNDKHFHEAHMECNVVMRLSLVLQSLRHLI